METDINKLYAALPDALLLWYQENARDLPWRKNHDPYRVWVSEIMLQQTRVEAVKNYYDRFLKALPTIKDLAEVDEETLLKLWEGLGYYSRARNLQKAAKTVMEKFGGVFPKDYPSVRSLSGIGDYTAGAISSICYDLPTPAVDGNVLRIIARITNDKTPIDLPEMKQKIRENLERVYPEGECSAFTQSLMELGACVCTPKSPKCEACPVKDICLSKKENTVNMLPVKLPKKEKRIEGKTVFLFRCEDCFAIQKRTEKGLLSGLWQLPDTKGKLSAEEALVYANSLGVVPIELCREIHKEHIFTHIRWDMVGYEIQCSVKSINFTWASAEELENKYALPTAYRKFLE